jgi:cellulose synthase/poly-beta-1,6-N-acetylglucosamine synthase-like glycosyltransferase/peptidoglycan/xylan/chitin deacetylase (PgdA/CDA1 family)/spore germination protein YaaH
VGSKPERVFHDPGGRRWRIVRAVGWPILIALPAVLFVLVVSVVVSPALPSVDLMPVPGFPVARDARPARAASETAQASSQDGTRTQLAATLSLGSTPPAPVGDPTRMIGYYVNWDDASYESLRDHVGSLTQLMPEWLHLARGELSEDDPVARSRATELIRTRRPKLPVTPLVNNYDADRERWDGDGLAMTLRSPKDRTRVIDEIAAFVTKNRFAGINVDFEGLPLGSRDDLTAFMRELSARLRSKGLEVSQSLPLSDKAFDYKALAECSDFLVLGTYTEHAAGSAAGPVSSQAWFAEQLRTAVADVPAEKRVIGLGCFGYDWDVATGVGAPITFAQALAISRSASETIEIDPGSLNPHFAYSDGQGGSHEVWLLDAVAAYNQIVTSRQFAPRGYALWRLGAEDPALWRVLDRRDSLDPKVAQSLRMLDQVSSVAYLGRGDIMKVIATPVDGSRSLSYDAGLGLITAESIVSSATPYVIQRWGASNSKTVALTFDDGPDPVFTQKILDVLRSHGVKATFFVVGENVRDNPQLLRDEFAQGHEVGNHTFTHPDLESISDDELRIQANATERLIESVLRRRTVLFRPPYGGDMEPMSLDRARPLAVTSALGYYTVGYGVDPTDWARPGTDKIVSSVLAHATNGSVILLHDSGGDRQQTVDALPRIIEGLRARGFAFATVSEMIGVSREAVMPALAAPERPAAAAYGVSLTVVDVVGTVLVALFLTAVFLGCLRLVLVVALAVFERVRERKRAHRDLASFRPSVSVLVPAFNEEKVIRASVESILASTYPDLEVVIVDDGSTDRTRDVVTQAFGLDPRVRLFTTANRGKAHALTHGLTRSSAEIVVAVDADTLFRPDTVSRLVEHFADPSVGAVAGNARVGNTGNLLTTMQAVEYVTVQNLDRRALDVLGCITVVPGAVGAWRRALVDEAGGFTDDTLAEDADLTLSILRRGAKIRYADDAVAITEAPETLRGLVRQRFRWVYGTLQAFWKHRGVAFRPSAGALGLVAYPNALLFQVLLPLLSPIVDLMLLGTLFGMLRQWIGQDGTFSPSALYSVLFFWAVFVFADMTAAAIAFVLDKGNDARLLPWVPLQRLFYRQLMYFIVVKSVAAAVKGTLVAWQHPESRVGVVDAVGDPLAARTDTDGGA